MSSALKRLGIQGNTKLYARARVTELAGWVSGIALVRAVRHFIAEGAMLTERTE